MRKFVTLLDFSDKEFYGKLLRISLPIFVQQLMASGLYFVDNIMIGWLGENEIAAVGLANQLTFLFFMCLIGVTGGGGVFIAQLWGKKDRKGIHSIQGIVLMCMLAVAALFVAVGFFLPRGFIGIFSREAVVLDLGASYLSIACFGYLAQSVSFTYASVLKNCNKVILPVVSSGIALVLNSLLNYILIFGKLGIPALGVRGAAIATVIALCADALIVTTVSYINKYPSAAGLRRMLRHTAGELARFVKVAGPVTLHELGWGTSVVVFTFFYGLLGTQTVAAMQIFNTIDRIAFITLVAVGTSCGIMCGNMIGEGRHDEAKLYARRFRAIMFFVGIVVGVLIATLGVKLLDLYNISDATKGIAAKVIMVYGCMLWVNSLAFIYFVGILRSGGDTAFSTACELIPMWLIAVPLFYLLGVALGLPLWVAFCGMVLSDIIKVIVATLRFRSGKWLHDVTATAHTQSEAAKS